MKVLQLIDSLEAGGAERVAVNLANALVSQTKKSYLCTTRAEGLLKETLYNDVGYLFLNKQSSIDNKAIKKLKTFIKEEGISIIHAHSSSFFLATLIKRQYKKVHIVWHDHYGNRPNSNRINKIVLKLCSKTFSYIFCVNKNLEVWSKNYLKFNEVSYLPNFVSNNQNKHKTKLLGLNSKRLVCLANLRPDKDHFTLLKAFKRVIENYPEWTLHCLGKDFNDNYSKQVREEVNTLNLKEHIFFYGSIPDVDNALNQSDIAILSSKSEGLPMALLEYGLAELPVIATNVGECATVITNKNNGLIVPSQDFKALSMAIIDYIEDKNIRVQYKISFANHIKSNYSEEAAINKVIQVYKKIV